MKNLQVSFLNVRFLEHGKFIGLKNYARVIADKNFWHAFRIMVEYSVIYTAGIFIIGFFTAFLLDKSPGRLKSVFRTFFILPYAIPDVVAAMVFMWMLDYQFGILNYIMKVLHIVKDPVLWFDNPTLALLAIIGIEIWRLFPLHTMIIFAGLQDVPQDLYEAANMDGANPVVKFFNVTIPYLRQVFGILLTLTIVWSLRRFAMTWLLTKGGPDRGTETLVIQIYSNAFSYNKMGYAATIGNLLLFITIAIVIFYFINRRKESEDR
jgi:ABC-type sugar transport systems, permease components